MQGIDHSPTIGNIAHEDPLITVVRMHVDTSPRLHVSNRRICKGDRCRMVHIGATTFCADREELERHVTNADRDICADMTTRFSACSTLRPLKLLLVIYM